MQENKTMEIYTVMELYHDNEWNPWETLNSDDLAFTTRDLAQQYIEKQSNPKDYFITELKLIGE